MGKAAAKQQVSEFSMSIHLGVCHGPVDAITGLFVGEKLAWEGEVTSTDPIGIYVDAPNLFGGPTSQGGVGGAMYYLPGGRNQTMPQRLAQRLGLTSATCPAYRGVASLFFVGTDAIVAGSLDVGDTSTYTPGVVDGSAGSAGGGGYATGGGGGGRLGRNPEAAAQN